MGLPEQSGHIRKKDGICLDADGSYNGSNVKMTNCRSLLVTKTWSYDCNTGRINVMGGFCLDAPEPAKMDGVVRLWECVDHKNQQWDYDYKTGKIKHRHGGCLDTYEGNRHGGRVRMWECVDHENQKLKLDPDVEFPQSGPI